MKVAVIMVVKVAVEMVVKIAVRILISVQLHGQSVKKEKFNIINMYVFSIIIHLRQQCNGLCGGMYVCIL